MALHVVVGAGGAGTATARLLAESGEQVRLVTRHGHGPEHPAIERVAANASDARRLTELVTGASTLFGCAAPPYHRWVAEFPALGAALLAAAERTGAGYVMLGNLYGYGAVDGPMTEGLPLAPNTRKGRVRAQLWQAAKAAYDEGRVRVTEVRASDFIGPGAASVINNVVIPKVLAGKAAAVPADLDAPHSWTIITDAARALVAAARHDDAWGRAWHVPTNPPVSVRDLADRFAAVSGSAPPKLYAMPGWLLRMAGLVSPLVRELPEVQYQFRRPFVLDSSLTEKTFGLSPAPLETAFG